MYSNSWHIVYGRDVCTDNFGDIYVFDPLDKICKYNSNLVFIKEWGRDGTSNSGFIDGRSIVADANNFIYGLERFNPRLVIFDLNGNIDSIIYDTNLAAPYSYHLNLTKNQDLIFDSGGSVLILNPTTKTHYSIFNLSTNEGGYIQSPDFSFALSDWSDRIYAYSKITQKIYVFKKI